MSSLVKFVEEKFVESKDLPSFSSGDTITVYYEIREGDKTRTQFFKGVVLQRRGSGSTETFTIRKMSGAIGVERIFPINSPSIQKIEVNKKSLLNLFLFMVSTFFRLSGYGLTLIRILVFWEAVNRVRMWWRRRHGRH